MIACSNFDHNIHPCNHPCSYAVNSEASFEKVKHIDKMLKDLHGGWADLPRVLVGTMIDLPDRVVDDLYDIYMYMLD
jgi:GTPase SAR1 family protein